MDVKKVGFVALGGGVLLWLYLFLMHGVIMANAYVSNPEVFRQAEGNPLWFLLIEVGVAAGGAILFGKTRTMWADGAKGGINFGLLLAIIPFFMNFLYPLIIAGFPYHLAWCWGGIDVIGFGLFGALAGILYKRAT